MKYKVMHRDQVIAYADDNVITEITKKELSPACFYIGMPLKRWLDNRAIYGDPPSRLHIMNLAKRTDSDIELKIAVGHGISITDNWWIQKSDENLEYRSLKSNIENRASYIMVDLSLHECCISSDRTELRTINNDEKIWHFYNNSWYIHRHGRPEKLISEYYSYLFLKAMGANVADYHTPSEVNPTYLIVRDFTGNSAVDFEPLCNYHDNVDLDNMLYKLDRKLLVPYVMMLFYDALLYNMDRHNYNSGVLRNSYTGDILGLSPYFDYNQALISVGTPATDMIFDNMLLHSLCGNDVCRSILKESLPKRERIMSAIRFATDVTKSIFIDEGIDYSLLEDYITETYEIFADEYNLKT